MGIVQSTIFKAGCKFYNWRNRKNESGSSDTQGLQNPVVGGSTSRIRQEPIKPELWSKEMLRRYSEEQLQTHRHKQMMLPFKPSRFREPYKNPRSKATPTNFYLIPGEKDEDRRKRLYGAPIYFGTPKYGNSQCSSAATIDCTSTSL